MIERSLDKRYRSPTEALLDIFDIAFYYFGLVAQFQVLAVLVFGGMVVGVLTELSFRFWR